MSEMLKNRRRKYGSNVNYAATAVMLRRRVFILITILSTFLVTSNSSRHALRRLFGSLLNREIAVEASPGKTGLVNSSQIDLPGSSSVARAWRDKKQKSPASPTPHASSARLARRASLNENGGNVKAFRNTRYSTAH